MINEFPDVLDIEPIHTCNLRCKMCHVSTEKLSHEKLDIARFLHALNGWTDRYAYVGSTHEPMAHPNFAALLRGLNDLKARLIITTNATLAPPPAVAALSDSKLERLYISFDGVTKETYEAVRRGGNFERTLGAVDRLIACKGHGVVSVNYTLMASSLADARRAVAFWEKRGVDGIGFIVAVRRSDLEEARAECLVDRSEEVASIMEEIALQVINEKKRIWVSSPIYSEPGFQSRYGAYTDANVVFGVPGGKMPPNPKQELVSIA